jgi:hypothetical protein
MTLEEHRCYYGSLSDASLRDALRHGPDGYADASAWMAVAEEAARRSVRVRAGAAPLLPDALIAPRPLDAPREAALHVALVHPDGQEAAVKSGFCWPAFCFPILWAGFHRLWPATAGLFLASALLGGIAVAVDGNALAWLGGLALRITIGRSGNALHLRQLERRGFNQVARVWATGPDDALTVWTEPDPTAPVDGAARGDRQEVL